MKKNIYFFFFCAILLSSCSSNSINSPEKDAKSLGKVSINIDKVNAPADVSVVIATLTKANSDTLTGYMNLATDTTASISFQNIAVGTWNLVVLAENASGVVLYQGESSVEVSEGTTTNVALTLNAVQNSTGNINITVTWGTTQPYFVDYSVNPVYTGSDNPSGPNYISEAKILYDNGVYKMWYISVYNSSAGNVWYAESSNGISWENKYNSPALNVGTSGSWDDLYVAAGGVINDNGTYRMYYNGGQMPYGDFYFGQATSTNGISWQKNPATMLSHDTSQYYIGLASVLKVNNTYYMYYSASPIDNYSSPSINLATSSDGVNWSKCQIKPVISPTLAWEGSHIAYPSVIYDGNQFVMIYQNFSQDGFGIAYSADGIHWTKKYNNPVFSVSKSITGNTNIEYPFLVKVNGEYRIYYTPSYQGIMKGIYLARTNNIQ